jgi:predicted GIY-YIG superfamily endonuclease
VQPFWVYMLRCGDGAFYVGHTDDLERRLVEHRWGRFPGFTSQRLPVELAFSEEFKSREEAQAAEQRLKGWSRAKKEALVRGDWERVRTLARGRTR